MKKDISIWLVPKIEQRQLLQEVIENLAQKYNSYPFIPHITVYYLGTSMRLKEAISIVNKASTGIKRFTVNAESINYSDIFTKTLFIQYSINEHLQNLYQKLKVRFQKYSDYSLNPHLSLIFKNGMSTREKEKEIKKIFYPKSLEIDSIMVITRNGTTITKEKDVLDWEIAFEKKF